MSEFKDLINEGLTPAKKTKSQGKPQKSPYADLISEGISTSSFKNIPPMPSISGGFGDVIGASASAGIVPPAILDFNKPSRIPTKPDKFDLLGLIGEVGRTQFLNNIKSDLGQSLDSLGRIISTPSDVFGSLNQQAAISNIKQQEEALKRIADPNYGKDDLVQNAMNLDPNSFYNTYRRQGITPDIASQRAKELENMRVNMPDFWESMAQKTGIGREFLPERLQTEPVSTMENIANAYIQGTPDQSKINPDVLALSSFATELGFESVNPVNLMFGKIISGIGSIYKNKVTDNILKKINKNTPEELVESFSRLSKKEMNTLQKYAPQEASELFDIVATTNKNKQAQMIENYLTKKNEAVVRELKKIELIRNKNKSEARRAKGIELKRQSELSMAKNEARAIELQKELEANQKQIQIMNEARVKQLKFESELPRDSYLESKGFRLENTSERTKDLIYEASILEDQGVDLLTADKNLLAKYRIAKPINNIDVILKAKGINPNNLNTKTKNAIYEVLVKEEKGIPLDTLDKNLINSYRLYDVYNDLPLAKEIKASQTPLKTIQNISDDVSVRQPEIKPVEPFMDLKPTNQALPEVPISEVKVKIPKPIKKTAGNQFVYVYNDEIKPLLSKLDDAKIKYKIDEQAGTVKIFKGKSAQKVFKEALQPKTPKPANIPELIDEALNYQEIPAGSRVNLGQGNFVSFIREEGDNVLVMDGATTRSIPKKDFYKNMLGFKVGNPTEELGAGINMQEFLLGKQAEGEGGMLKKIGNWFQRTFTEYGRAPKEVQEALTALRGKVGFGKQEALMQAEKLNFNNILQGQSDDYAKVVRNASTKVLKGEYNSVDDILKNTIIQDEKHAKEILDTSLGVADYVANLGKQLVDAGLLNEETYFKNMGRYFPRMYRKYEYARFSQNLLDDAINVLSADESKEAKAWLAYLKNIKDPENSKYFETLNGLTQYIKDKTSSGNIVLSNSEQKLGREWRRIIDKSFIPDDFGFMYVKKGSKENSIIQKEIITLKNMQVKYPQKGVNETATKSLNIEYLKKRKNIPEEIRVYLGEIIEPAYPIAKRTAQMESDIAKADLYKMIADNYAVDRLSGIDPKIANDFVRITDPKFGELGRKQLYVHKDIAKQLKYLMQDESNDWIRGIMQFFKRAKTVWNVPTQMRNVQWNIISDAITYGDIPLSKNYRKAFGIFKNAKKDQIAKNYIDIAKQANLLQGSFTDDLFNQLNNVDYKTIDDPTTLISLFKKIDKKLGEAYHFGDDFFKLKAFMEEAKLAKVNLDELASKWHTLTRQERLDYIMGNADKGIKGLNSIAKEAKDAITSYDELPRIIRVFSNMPFLGKPFIAFPYTFATRTLPKMFRHSVGSKARLLFAVFALQPIASSMGRWATGSEPVKEVKQRAKWQQNQDIEYLHNEGFINDDLYVYLQDITSGQIPLPMRDQYGRIQYFDAQNLFPWMDFLNRNKLLFQDPMLNEASAQMQNRDQFFKTPIVSPADSPLENVLKRGQHIGQTFLPATLMKSPIKLWKAGTGATDEKGRQYDVPQALLSELAGIKVQSVDPEITLDRKMREIDATVRELQSNIKQNDSSLRRNIISQEAWERRNKSILNKIEEMEKRRSRIQSYYK